ncbi:MAG: hypothetical protein RL701_2077 [Pseudomonadota bacterium]
MQLTTPTAALFDVPHVKHLHSVVQRFVYHHVIRACDHELPRTFESTRWPELRELTELRDTVADAVVDTLSRISVGTTNIFNNRHQLVDRKWRPNDSEPCHDPIRSSLVRTCSIASPWSMPSPRAC